ncbi:hypothetical protein D7V97_15615 [Corallococcus sp. CA053C]|uniref:hypothetical protein n=1 Tax=Corallococcus sp. CA053C TaxID=2316732 RepID=UPI000EA26730|nr:hypothetical protein [Corallococcus sp. CA053C]RKH09738.1 hypothetical protein D7V97_15615 [Corallococcus sp. CA053C]
MPSAVDLLTADQLPPNVRDAVDATTLGMLITAASEALASYVGYPLHLRTGVVESVASQGGRYLFLRSGAVRQVERVEVCGVEVPPAHYLLEVGTLGVSMGRILSRGAPWPFTGEYSPGVSPTPLHAHDTGEILVTFTAGWVTPGQADSSPPLEVNLPAVFVLAARIVVTAYSHRDGQDWDVTSESIGGTSIGYGADSMRGGRPAIPLAALALVERYRKLKRGGVA